MTEKQTRDAFTRRVIELNHPGMTYEEAVNVEFEMTHANDDVDPIYFRGFSISLARVLQALNTRKLGTVLYSTSRFSGGENYIRMRKEGDKGILCNWKLTENGYECDADDQDIETIEKLLTLLQ